MRLHCNIPLPEAFRSADILAFHRRDPQEISERVSDRQLEKGMVWHGRPALLTVVFQADAAKAELDVGSEVPPDKLSHEAMQGEFSSMVRRMLGLAQGVEDFELQHGAHPQLGRLIAQQRGLRVPATATSFEALAWAITGQQISVAAAVSVRRRLIQLANIRHGDAGLLCHPDAVHLADLTEAALREAGFSGTKAATLLAISRMVRDGQLPLDDWARTMPIEDMRATLEAIRGIGPWTVNYTLLRGFGWMDGSLHGDVAVRRSLQALLGEEQALSETRTREWLAAFAPWRALVAAHLWAARSAQAY